MITKNAAREVARDSAALDADLLRLRACLVLIRTRHGRRLPQAARLVRELRSNGVNASLRSLYRWRKTFLVRGFEGLARHARSDSGRPRSGVLLSDLASAALRVRQRGDIKREYSAFSERMCYETFRTWMKRLRGRVVVMGKRGQR